MVECTIKIHQRFIFVNSQLFSSVVFLTVICAGDEAPDPAGSLCRTPLGDFRPQTFSFVPFHSKIPTTSLFWHRQRSLSSTVIMCVCK